MPSCLIRCSLSLVLTGVLLAACSSATPPPAPDATAPVARVPTVIDPQLQALDKAKAVQKQVDDQARQTRDAIERAGG